MKSDQNSAGDQVETIKPVGWVHSPTFCVTWIRHRWANTHTLPATPAALSAILALLMYSVTLWGTYIYDDIPIVQTDQRVRQPHLWGKLWTTDYFNGGLENLYRPLVSSSYAIEWWLHGDRPWIFHGVNLLLHVIAAASVAEFTRRALRGSSSGNAAALIAGTLFAVHPAHVEAVANIVGRAELACDVGLLGSLIILCRRPFTISRGLSAFALGAIAILCKEQGILAPLFWVLLGWLLWRYPGDLPVLSLERKAMRFMVLTTTWGWAIYLVIREHFLRFEWDRAFLDTITQPMIASFGINRILMPVVLLGHYTTLLFWPTRLSLDYGADVIGSHIHWSDPFLWIGFAAGSMWGIAIAWTWIRGNRFILFCLLAMAISYGVIGNIFTLIGTNYAERLIYLPSAFFLMIAGVLIARVPPKLRTPIVVVLIALMATKCFAAARVWNNPMLLFQDGIHSQPKSLQLRFLLAQEYHAQGDYDKADAAIEKACEIYPNYWRVWYQRGLEAMDDGRFELSRKCLDTAQRLYPNPMIFYANNRLEQMQAATRPATKP